MSVSDQHHQQQSQHQFGQAGVASAPFQITSTYIPSYQTAQIPASTTSSSSSSAPSYPTMLPSYTATQQSPANNPAHQQTYGAQYSHYLQQQQQQQEQQQQQQQSLEPLPSIFVTQNQSRVTHQVNETLYPAYYGTGISTGTNSSTNAVSTVSNAAAPSINSGSGTNITYSAVPSYSPYMQLGDNGQYSTTAPLPSSSSSTSASASSPYSYQQINPYSTSLAPGYNAVHTHSHQPQMHSSQRYPASPASMSDKTSISSVASTASMPPLPQPHLYASNTTTMMAPPMPSQQQQQQQQQHHQSSLTSSTNLQYAPSANTKGEEIDYSSIVSYTISPSLKRKRRQKKSNLVTPSSSLSLSSSSASSSILDPLNRTETYPCPQCDKVFQKPYNLKSHMKTHSTEKPFQCSYCPKTFARSHDKKRHEVLHKGTKNFKCEGYLQDGKTRWGCGKRFARSDALSRHFRTETGWLCIRPLMDEAKRLEEQGFPTNLSKNQSINSNGAGVAGLPRLDEYASGLSQMHQHSQSYTNQQQQQQQQQGTNSGEHNDETYDNSQLIRKMIYNK
ncbi:DNA-binding transcription factor [Lodderomyces elongisporus]|uniref:DNA-binding transcription factor n=1 Tax=Lodderomyces elongisporus TaxID=36914 RepID=UPI0029260894|nr:DNA-binding transcription factor [Lodderomyces elongisporus]WLF79171.1 DNA-binding transcription factor [Lodderomyces elongisporus]